MPFVAPGPGQVHVNRPLTNISIAYMQMAVSIRREQGVSEHPSCKADGSLLRDPTRRLLQG